MCTAVRQLRNNGASGEGGIPAEVYKTCFDSLGPWLHWVIAKVRLCEVVTNNWSEAIFLHIFKKGEKRICSNYRGISLIDVASTVMGVILLKSFRSERELRRRLCLTNKPTLFVQRRLRWFGHAARRPEGELIKGLHLSTTPRTWLRRTGDVGNHAQGRPGASFSAANIRLRTMEKGLSERL